MERTVLAPPFRYRGRFSADMIRTLTLAITLAAVLALATTSAAIAQLSVEPGVWGVNGTTQFGGAVSLQVFKTPVLPMAVEVTGAAPFDRHGFAATADLRFSLAKTTFGAGIGGGDLAHNSVT